MIKKALELWEWCRKTAQRKVIKLFNVSVVVRAAKIKRKGCEERGGSAYVLASLVYGSIERVVNKFCGVSDVWLLYDRLILCTYS